MISFAIYYYYHHKSSKLKTFLIFCSVIIGVSVPIFLTPTPIPTPTPTPNLPLIFILIDSVKIKIINIIHSQYTPQHNYLYIFYPYKTISAENFKLVFDNDLLSGMSSRCDDHHNWVYSYVLLLKQINIHLDSGPHKIPVYVIYCLYDPIPEGLTKHTSNGW